MADQGKWFKLWCSSLNDFDLENLSVHEWFCWVRFGAYMKAHGKDGKIRLTEPATAIKNLMRVTDFKDAISIIKLFPNYTIEEGQSVTDNVTVKSVTYLITCRYWPKYQGDFSGDRVKKHRRAVTANVTAQEEKRREEKRQEEKRQEKNTPKPPEFDFASLWNAYPKRLGRKNAERHFRATVRTDIDFRNVSVALANYRKHIAGKEMQFVKNGDTWFNNWSDWINYTEGKHAPNGVEGVSEYASIAKRARETQALRAVGEVSGGTVFDRVRDLSVAKPETERGT